jgi:hypothetical protein
VKIFDGQLVAGECEGYAHGKSLSEATGKVVLVGGVRDLLPAQAGDRDVKSADQYC